MINNMIYEYYKYKLYKYIIGPKIKYTKNIKLKIYNYELQVDYYYYLDKYVMFRVYKEYLNNASQLYIEINVNKEFDIGYDKFPYDKNLRYILNDFK